jgi:TldD protein
MSATSDNLQLARRTILTPGGLDDRRLDRMLGLVMDHAVDSADLSFQVSREESWALEDGIVKEGSASIEEGVGVRAIAGEKTGFAYSDEIHPAALEEASRAARAIAKQSPGKGVQAWQRVDVPQLYAPIDPLASMEDAVKVAWL